MDLDQIALPPLRDDLTLLPGPRQRDGAPSWTIYDPLRNRYFRIGFMEFQMLTRWAGRASDMIDAVERDTAIRPGESDLSALAEFLSRSQLIQAVGAEPRARLLRGYKAAQHGWMTWLLHHYLFIRVPLLRPDRLLDALRPLVGLLYTRQFTIAMGIGLAVALALIASNAQAYIADFLRFANPTGIAFYLLAIVIAKIIHEFGHALTCRQYGLRVPTMGIAFVVLVPMLYTDVSNAARLTRRAERLHIGAGGMLAEFFLAILATLVWAAASPGALRDAAFLLSSTSLIATLAINISPFMRFDGYYLLADLLEIENLQPRSFTMARWWLRKRLIGLDDPCPDPILRNRINILLPYAMFTWIYRLIIFLSIAFIVYAFVVKLIGIFLMLVELGWFIAKPIWSEMRTLVNRRDDIGWNRRSVLTASVVGAVILLLVLPWIGGRDLPAVLVAQSKSAIHAPIPARILDVKVRLGDQVKAGQVLVVLDSPGLRRDQVTAASRAVGYATQIARSAGDTGLTEEARVTAQLRDQAKAERGAADAQLRRLTLVSPIDGVVTEVMDGADAGRWVNPSSRLLEIVDRRSGMVDAYAGGDVIGDLQLGAHGVFRPAAAASVDIELSLTRIDPADLKVLAEASLASSHGGPLAVEARTDGILKPLQPTYRVAFSPLGETPVEMSVPGWVHVETPRWSLAGAALRRLAAVIIRESGF